ncbi:hypothetical protein V6N11_008422 [Hibiscus sabdariffa]|uniref:Uncharacterized protein n=2 Tax=Hibiscus sabdariffa TaxID=183260 RepID=A0ABR2P891_9ROSI
MCRQTRSQFVRIIPLSTSKINQRTRGKPRYFDKIEHSYSIPLSTIPARKRYADLTENCRPCIPTPTNDIRYANRRRLNRYNSKQNSWLEKFLESIPRPASTQVHH